MSPKPAASTYQFEDDLAVESAAYLDHVLPDDAVWWHTPNQSRGGGAGDLGAIAMANKLKAMGMKPGILDIVIIWHGCVYTTDAKSATGSLGQSQKDMIVRLIRAGAHVKPVYRSIEELESHLVEWGIPLRFRYTELKNRSVMKPSEANAMTAIALASVCLKKRRSARVGSPKNATKLPASNRR